MGITSSTVMPISASSCNCRPADSQIPSGVNVPDVHLINHLAFERPAFPCGIRPLEAAGIDDL